MKNSMRSDAAGDITQPTLTTVPTWDAIFADPSVFKALPPKVQTDIYAQVAVMEAKLRAQMLATPTSERTVPEPDDLILIEEAAAMLRTSVDTLYSKWSKLLFAFKDPLDGKIKFTRGGVAQYIAGRVPNRRLT